MFVKASISTTSPPAPPTPKCSWMRCFRYFEVYYLIILIITKRQSFWQFGVLILLHLRYWRESITKMYNHFQMGMYNRPLCENQAAGRFLENISSPETFPSTRKKCFFIRSMKIEITINALSCSPFPVQVERDLLCLLKISDRCYEQKGELEVWVSCPCRTLR